MKKSSKIILIGSGLCVALGIVLCLVAIGIGRKNGEITRLVSDVFEATYKHNVVPNANGEAVAGKDDIYNVDGAKKLYVNSGVAKIVIEKMATSSNSIIVDMSKASKRATVKKDNDTLRINDGSKTYVRDLIDNNQQITVYIPDGKLNSLEIYNGIGDLQASDIVVAGDTKILLGIGKITFENCKTDNGEFNVSLGDLNYYGDVNKEISTRVDFGNILFDLEQSADDYNYQFKNNTYNVFLDDEKLAIDSEKRIDNNSDKEVKVDMKIGNVKIKVSNKGAINNGIDDKENLSNGNVL